MPFRYQLQKVLDLMERREKSLDAEVMEASAIRNRELDKFNEMDTRKAAAQKGLQAQMASGATGDVAASNDYIQLLNLRLEQQNKMLKAADAQLEDAKKRQFEARKERQKIEKHKEMKLAEYKIVEKKKDAQKIDEMAGTIFMKKRYAAEEANLEELDRLEKLQKLRLLQEMREKREKGNRW
jgi:flagellar export protein FliJ